MLARPSTPCQHTAHACLPPHTLCMPAPLAHTPVTRYSTRHSRPKPSTALRNRRPALTTIFHTAILLSPRALLRLCSRCHSKRALLLERRHRARPLAMPTMRHHMHQQQQAHRHDAALQEFTYLGHITRHASFPALPAPARSPLTSRGPPLSFRPCRTEPTAPTGNHCMTRAGSRAKYHKHLMAAHHCTFSSGLVPA
jgi:hypothetical protein